MSLTPEEQPGCYYYDRTAWYAGDNVDREVAEGEARLELIALLGGYS